MPFTLAHPAAVVPLARRGLPFSALVVGSMAPDFPYFFISSHHSHYGHTLPGVFFFCLPAGLVALWLFHSFLKMPLLWLLPRRHQERLRPLVEEFRWGPTRQFTLILAALLIGIVTHLVWDSFTHPQGWSVQHIALLRVIVFKVQHGSRYSVSILLQLFSSVGGVVFLILCYFRWLQTAKAGPIPAAPVRTALNKRLACTVIAISVLLFAFVYGNLSVQSGSLSGLLQFVASAGIGGIAAFTVELIGFCVIWHLRMRRLPEKHGAPS